MQCQQVGVVQGCVLHVFYMGCGFSPLMIDCHSKPVHIYFFQVVAQACVLHGFYIGCGIIDLNQFTCNVKKLVWLKHVFYMCFTRVVVSVHELLVVILNQFTCTSF